MTRLFTGTLLLAGALALAGCPKKSDELMENGGVGAPPAPDDDDGDPNPVPIPNAEAEAEDTLRANFARVHFEVDSSALDADSLAALDDNAALLVQFPNLRVEIQGHADERGTTDYNLALGQRRAAAIEDRLVASGAAPGQLAIVSYGEERPVAEGDDEVAWSANRRAEFRILAGPETVAGTVR